LFVLPLHTFVISRLWSVLRVAGFAKRSVLVGLTKSGFWRSAQLQVPSNRHAPDSSPSSISSCSSNLLTPLQPLPTHLLPTSHRSLLVHLHHRPASCRKKCSARTCQLNNHALKFPSVPALAPCLLQARCLAHPRYRPACFTLSEGQIPLWAWDTSTTTPNHNFPNLSHRSTHPIRALSPLP
jgi:hypothetical protein